MDKLSDSDFAWATVYSDNPVTVRRDGETEPIGVTPGMIIPPSLLKTGNRVWCQFVNRRAIILGKAKGVWPIFWGGIYRLSGVEPGKGDNATITLPSGVFTEMQNILITTASPRLTIAVDDISTTSFYLRCYNWTSKASDKSDVRWTAVGR